MTQSRKRADVREKELRLAIHRIQRGRAHTKVTVLSIASVAEEAGVSSALIHNYYPKVAEDIRLALGKSSRDRAKLATDSLKALKEKSKALREELRIARGQVTQLASLNEMLLDETRTLRAQLASPKVVGINRQSG